jgi:uncharacterized protein YeaO (DUF488 family)
VVDEIIFIEFEPILFSTRVAPAKDKSGRAGLNGMIFRPARQVKFKTNLYVYILKLVGLSSRPIGEAKFLVFFESYCELLIAMRKLGLMLLRASISEIKNGIVTKKDGYLVVTMRMYPRFLSKSLIDGYKQALSPQKELFERYREIKKQIGDQNEAFELSHYQQKFALEQAGLQELRELVKVSENQNVYLICQCETNERCHVDLILLIAKKELGAKIGELPFEYFVFCANL